MSKQKDSKQNEVKHHEKVNKAVEIKDTKNSPELDKKKKIENIKSEEENKFVEKNNLKKIKYESFENKLIKQIILMVFTLILSLGMIYYALNNYFLLVFHQSLHNSIYKSAYMNYKRLHLPFEHKYIFFLF